jgi:SulP family sulfate permease
LHLPLQPAALTVAILSAVESLLSAVVGEAMSGDRHNSNAELMGQGIANLAVPLVGGIPVTGAIAGTATTFRAGARSPVAALVHAITLLAVVLLASRARVPLHQHQHERLLRVQAILGLVEDN